VKADKAKALAMFNNGEGGFKDRDLYPFCFNIGDGKVNATAAKTLIGTDCTNSQGQDWQGVWRRNVQGGERRNYR
jgi:hypothetical protein